MNNQDELNETLKWLRESGQKGQAFIEEQAPLYAQEVIKWETGQAYIGLAIGLIAALLCPFLIRKFKHASNECFNDRELVYLVLIIIAFATALTTLPIATFDLYKVKAAPRVVIVEHLKGL